MYSSSHTSSIGMQMLNTMHSQYLNPDFMSPLSSSDVKESPLALLAQTCSAIGKDPDDGKGNNNNNNKKETGRESAGSKSDISESGSPDPTKERNNSERSRTISPLPDKPGFRVPNQKDMPPLV